MKRILTATLLAALAVVLTACPQPAEPPPPLTLTWTRVLETPDQDLLVGYAGNDSYVYVAAEELPLDLNYEEKWLSLWRLDGEGNVVGPVRYPDEAAVSELAAAGMGCPQPMYPRVALDGNGNFYVAVAARNTHAQEDGCATYDGEWNANGWTVFAAYDQALQRSGLNYLKSFGSDDPTYAAVLGRIAGLATGIEIAGGYVPDSRIDQAAPFRGSMTADGQLQAALAGTVPSSWGVQRVYTMPEDGWLEAETSTPDLEGYTERLIRFDAAGNEVWSLVTARESFPPTQDAVGVAGSETVFVSGMVYDGDAYAGVEPPESAQERAHFVARIDGGELKWIRWISAESDNWLYPNHYADVAVAYDPEYGEVYAAMNDVVMALDPESGETKWITDIIEFAPSSENPDEDWYFTYQPQNFDGLYVVDGGLIAMSTSWWDTDGRGHATEISRYRPLVLRLDRNY